MPLMEPFEISYCGVTTKITPLANSDRMQYIVSLPTREVIIETKFDDDELHYWVETNGERTEVAEEIGAVIESRDM